MSRSRHCALFFLVVLVLVGTPPAQAKKPLVLPEVGVQVVTYDGGHPVAGADVDLLVRDRGDRFEVRGSAKTGDDGWVRFPSRPGGDIDFFGVRVGWDEPQRPRRSLIYQMKAKKGDKVSAGRLARAGKGQGFYAVYDQVEEGCENLFRQLDGGRGIEVAFFKPVTYAQCEATEIKHADATAIGHRDINAGSLNLFSFDRDVEMGRDFWQTTGREQPPLDDPLVSAYVEDVVSRIGRASDMPGLDFHVQVIDADVLNAFALPGGYVFVYRGLIEATETEAELVGVLAHEIAHVTGRHGTEGVTSAMGKMLGAMVLGGLLAEELSNDRRTQELILGAVMAGTNFWVIGGTRKREAEADRIGSQYALRAGYDPRGIASFFHKLSTQRDRRQTRLDQFFSDHPNDETRIANVNEMVDYFLPATEGQLITSSPDFQRVKRRLTELPPPRLSGDVAANTLMSSFKAANEELIWVEFLSYVEGQNEQGGE